MAQTWHSFIGRVLASRGIVATNGKEYAVFKDRDGIVQVRWDIEGVPLAEIQAGCEALMSAPDILKEYAASRRRIFEASGVSVGGTVIATTPESLTKIEGAQRGLAAGLITGSIDFKAESGWLTASFKTVSDIHKAVLGHIQDAYSRERAVCDDIDAGTITTRSEIDTRFMSSDRDRSS